MAPSNHADPCPVLAARRIFCSGHWQVCLPVSDSLFIPGQSYPITMRPQGEDHAAQLFWEDAKKR